MVVLIDATELPGYLLPWQHLLSVVLDKLSENAVPRDQGVIASLRGELLTAVQAAKLESPEASEILIGNFANRFRSSFPKLAQNVVGAVGRLLVIAVDHLDKVSSVGAAELFEAASYFLKADDVRLVCIGDDKMLGAKLTPINLSESWSAKVELGKWMTIATDKLPGQGTTRVTGASLSSRTQATRNANGDWALSKVLAIGPMVSIGLGVLFVDQLSKIIIRGLAPWQLLGGLLRIGVLDVAAPSTVFGTVLPVLVELLAATLAGLLIILAVASSAGPTTAARIQKIGLSVALGALLSNILDRLVAGGVLNFIQIGAMPVFNLAHIALASGALLVGFSILRKP